jgi:hypothetical protein
MTTSHLFSDLIVDVTCPYFLSGISTIPSSCHPTTTQPTPPKTGQLTCNVQAMANPAICHASVINRVMVR